MSDLSSSTPREKAVETLQTMSERDADDGTVVAVAQALAMLHVGDALMEVATMLGRISRG